MSEHGTSQPGRVGPLVGIVAVIVAVALIAWSGISGSRTGVPEPSGSPITDGSATPEQPDPALLSYYNQSVAWADCDEGFECGSLTVPLDYQDPAGKTIKLALIRLLASKPEDRIGSLLLNPGGPGGSGIEYVKAATMVTTGAVRDVYDLVGFDPRGVGQSEPVNCLTQQEADELLASDATVDNEAEEADIISAATDFGAKCEARDPEIARHIDTVSVAKDVDILRAVLGDERLNWLGKSYGTYIGAIYAELFPGRVGRMVLDGAVDPNLGLIELTREQAQAFEVALDRYISNCVGSGDCPLGNTTAKAKSKFAELRARVKSSPLSTGDKARPLTESLFLNGVLLGLYQASYGWDSLTIALQGMVEGDGEPMLSLVDLFTNRVDGKFQDNSLDALSAVNCLDFPVRPTLSEVEALTQELKKSAPVFGEWIAWSALSCTYWPFPAPHDRVVKAEGTAQVLIIGTTYDPATPVQWATGLSRAITNSVVVTFNGDGHTAYLEPGATCVNRIVDAYLVNGLSPEGNTVCN